MGALPPLKCLSPSLPFSHRAPRGDAGQLSDDSTRCTCAWLPVVVAGPDYEYHMQTMMAEGIRGRITRALAGVTYPGEKVEAIRTITFVEVSAGNCSTRTSS